MKMKYVLLAAVAYFLWSKHVKETVMAETNASHRAGLMAGNGNPSMIPISMARASGASTS